MHSVTPNLFHWLIFTCMKFFLFFLNRSEKKVTTLLGNDVSVVVLNKMSIEPFIHNEILEHKLFHQLQSTLLYSNVSFLMCSELI